MTVLIERVTVTFTLNHCKANPPSTVLGGTNNIRQKVRSAIEAFADGPIEWKSTGLMEEPELGGCDN